MAVDLSFLLFFGVVFLLCFFYLKTKARLYPPGPLGIPLIGTYIWIARRRRPAESMFQHSKRLGSNVLGLRTVFSNTVVIHGYDLIHDTFVKRADEFSFRPSWLKAIQIRIKEGKGVVWQDGPEWRSMRRFALQTLRDFGVGKTSLEDKIMAEVDAATKVLIETGGKPYDVRPLTSQMIFNVIYGIVFGRRLDYDDELCTTAIHHLDNIFKGDGLTSRMLLPDRILKLVNKKKYEQRKQQQESFEWIKDHVYQEIADHAATFDKENIRDFIDLYVESKGKEENGESFNTVGNMYRLILDLFIAGSETTSNTVNWCILYAMEYPDVQRKCQEEIEKVCGDRTVTYADRKSLIYVEATLLEIQRMSNIAGFSVPHANIEDTTIDGYFIPKRSLVLANLLSSNMDRKYWNEPETFNPDRFIENGKLKKNPALIPFSIGPRVCLGESLAKMEMFLIFSNLLSRFTFVREDQNVAHTFKSNEGQATNSPVAYRTRALQRT